MALRTRSMERIFRRTIAALATSYALMWAGMSMVAGPGSQALVRLSGNLSHAGLFIAVIYVAAAAAAAIAGRIMDRTGRRPVLVASHALAAVGYLVAGQGVAKGSLELFIAGTIAFSMGFGAGNLTRVAVAEMFPPALRGRGIATVQLSATVGAVTGPLLLLGSVPIASFLTTSALVLVWYFAPPLLLLASAASAVAAEPLAIARNLDRYHPASVGAPPTAAATVGFSRPLIAGGIALAASHAAMAALMGVAGAAVHHAGHSARVLGILMLVHFVGMFGLSRQVGGVADRFGRRRTILAGLGLLALGGATAALGLGVWGFGAGLLLAGLGWSFGFIGGTVLLTDATQPRHRARIIGRADLLAQLGAALVALAGGWWFAQRGLAGLGSAAAIIVAVAAGAVLLLSQRLAGPSGQTPLTPDAS